MRKRHKSHLFFGFFFIGFSVFTFLKEGEFVLFWRSPVSKLYLGSMYLVFGCLALLLFILRKPKANDAEYVKCLNCKVPLYKKEIINGICPKCGGTVEDMNGIFERHPELK